MGRKKQNFRLSKLLEMFENFNVKTHIAVATTIRLVLIAYGIFQDEYLNVPYTDIDYKVFTDAARHVVDGNSPYHRRTYRYSPLIAYLLIPNIILHSSFGKFLFSLIDILAGYLIRKLVYVNVLQIRQQFRNSDLSSKKINKSDANLAKFWSNRAMLLWLYNPMTIIISSRGNSDCLACLPILFTLYLLQTNQHPFKAGILHGFSIHFRLYPIIYSLSYFLYLNESSYCLCQDKKLKPVKKIKKNKINNESGNGLWPAAAKQAKYLYYLFPNVDQLMLIMGTATSFLSCTGIFCYLYGYPFLYESLIYHLVRVDFKHNFSLFFYVQYLTTWMNYDEESVTSALHIWQSLLMNLPSIILLFRVSIRYGFNKSCLNFAVLLETIVFVIYNKVLTSQYFVWIMGILPLCIWQIKMSRMLLFALLAFWILAQAAWLLPAYLLEYQGQNTFLYIWIQGISLFCAHIAILGRLIKHFSLPTVSELKKY